MGYPHITGYAASQYVGETIHMMLRAIVVEDDSLTRLTLVSAMERAGIEVIGDAGKAGAAIEMAKSLRPDVAVLDLHLGQGPTGVDVAQAFRKLDPGIGIVFLTSYEDPRLLNLHLSQMPAGAGYLLKKSVKDIHALLEAIKVSMSVKRNTSLPVHPTGVGILTDAQIETLKLVAQGLSNAEIAKRRFVKEKSVEMTVSRMAKALGVSSSTTQNQRVHLANVYFRAIGMNPND